MSSGASAATQLVDAGVPVVAGTDEGVPGLYRFSVYRGMELYVKAGMTPMDALRAVTSVPARAMKMDAGLGSIPGRSSLAGGQTCWYSMRIRSRTFQTCGSSGS